MPDPDVYWETVGFLGLDDGYVLLGNSDLGAWTSFSRDGVEWTHQFLADKACTSISSPQIGVGASNGHDAVIVGHAGRTDPCDVDDMHFAAWRSSEGEHWAAAPAEGIAGIEEFNPDALWWTPSGWQSDAGESPDGKTWQPIELPVDPVIANGPYGFAAPDGTVLLRSFSHPVRLHVGGDGLPWREMPFPAGCEGTSLIAPPGVAGRDSWVFFEGEEDATCVSVDLQHWTRGVVGAPAGCGVLAVADTRFGIVATVGVTRLGDECDAPANYVSRDGVNWIPIEPGSERPYRIADGPAGVIGIGVSNGGSLMAWRLEG